VSLLAFDLETHKVQPGLLAPPIVCASWCFDGKDPVLQHRRFDGEHFAEWVYEALVGPEIICGANIAYDMGCLAVDEPSLLPAIFAKYDRGEVFDVLIAQTLDAIAKDLLRDEYENKLIIDARTGQTLLHPHTGKPVKRYSLEVVTWLNLGRADAKANDFWRLRYALLENTPLNEWPEGAKQYPLDDARNTLEVALAQRGGKCENLHDMPRQAWAALALQLGSIHGVRANKQRVADLKAWTEWMHDGARDYFQKWGLVDEAGDIERARVKRRVVVAYAGEQLDRCATCGGSGRGPFGKNGSDVQCKKCDATGIALTEAVPRTPANGIAADRDTLQQSGDEALEQLAVYGPNDKIASTYLPFLEKCAEQPQCFGYNVLLSTGRSSSSSLAQTFPQKGGARECLEELDGWLMCSADYAAIEMVTLAEVWFRLFGKNNLQDAINNDLDPHCLLGEQIFRIPYDEFSKNKKLSPYKEKRDSCKAGNFGYGGMMSAPTFVLSNRKKGISFCVPMGLAKRCGEKKTRRIGKREFETPSCLACVDGAQQIRDGWLGRWDCAQRYFDWVVKWLDEHDNCIWSFGSRRKRRVRRAPQGANNGFQAMAADGAKEALRLMTTEMYTDKSSPLYGCRLLNFSHDETIIAIPPWQDAHDASWRQCALMKQGMEVLVKNVKVTVEPALMQRWYKAAAMVADKAGRLVPWEPETLKYNPQKRLWE
jgi:DNA polymerase-1